MPTPQCRAMQKQDIEQVCAIEQQVQYHAWNQNQFLESLKHYQCWVLAVDQQIYGFCIMQPVLDEANLLLMAIHPKQQGNGYGFQLLEYAIQQLGQDCVQIFLEVRQSNITAINLYEKVGFHQIDLRKNYYPCPDGSKEHAIIMVKMLREELFGFTLDHKG